MRKILSQAGFTLVEVIVVIVVIAIIAVSIFGVFQKAVVNSADPMLRVQAIAVAQGYLEEALLQPFQDPDQAETGSCEEGARQNYDDVQDYDCINDTAGALDQLGNPLAGLGSYNVDVNVTATTLGTVQLATAQRVLVTVTHDTQSFTVLLTGYRTNY